MVRPYFGAASAPRFLAFVLLLVSASAASAHTSSGDVNGFASGFLHPLTGPDHVVAMVAVGLWGAFLGAPAAWLLPVVFPVVMAVGGALGVLGVPLPGVESGIALSGVVLGAMILCKMRAPIRAAAVTQFSLGAWLSAVVVAFDIAFYVNRWADRDWRRIGVRVAGSWMIATSLILLAFDLRK